MNPPYESNPERSLVQNHNLPSGGGPEFIDSSCNQSPSGRDSDRYSSRLAALSERARNLPFNGSTCALAFLIGSLKSIDLSEEVMCAVERTITNAESNRYLR